MKKKLIFKRGIACLLSAAMVLAGAGIMPVAGNKAKAAAGKILPTPNYCFDFEGDLTADGAAAVESSDGTVEIITDGTKGKVLHITDGGTEVFGENYYKLPADAFKGVTAETGTTVSMNVNIPSTLAHEWSVLFNSTPSAYNSWGLFKINANLVCNINAGDPHAYGDGAVVSITKDAWHNLTITITKEKLILYQDGASVGELSPSGGYDFEVNGWTGPLNALANNAFNVLGAGGFPTDGGKTGDRDISDCYYDDVTIYNQALTAEEIDALYKKTSLPANALTLDETTANVTNTYYTDADGEVLSSECGSVQLTASLSSGYAKSVVWSVDNAQKATVDKTGNVELTDKVQDGDEIVVTATATGCDGATQTATCTITAEVVEVVDGVKVESLTIADKTLGIGYASAGDSAVVSLAGDSFTVEPEFTPANATIKGVDYETNVAGSEIIDIDGNKITALKAGEANVTATSKSSDHPTATFKVKVENKIPADFSAGAYLSNNSGFTKLEGNFNVEYSFHNVSTGTSQWDNFIVKLADGTEKSLVARADAFATKNDFGAIEWDTGGLSWDEFKASGLAGVDVKVNIARVGDNITLKYNVGNKYTITGRVTGTDISSVLYSGISGEKVNISNLTFKHLVPVTVTVSNPDATVTNGEITAFDTTKVFYAGDIVSVETKPAAGYTADITVEGASGATVETTASQGEGGKEIISFTMPEENVTITYNNFKGVSHDAIKAAIAAAKTTLDAGNDNGKYSAVSWGAFTKAYNDAVKADANTGASQGELDDAQTALEDSKTALVPVCKVALSAKEIYLTAGGTQTITATVTSLGADKSVTWMSSNSTVATVDGGVVTAVAIGTAIITATAADGTKATCEVVVTDPSSSVGSGGNTVIVNPSAGAEPTEAPEVKAVGSEDRTTGWWSAFSKHYRLSGDFNFNIDFDNHGDGATVWNNYVMIFTNQSAAAESERLDGYAEYAVVRADNWGWAGGDNTALSGSPITYSVTPDGVNMSDVVKDSNVKMNVARKGSDITITETVTSLADASKSYTRTVTFKAGTKDGKDDGKGDVYFTLTVDHAYLVINSSSGDSAGTPGTSAAPSTNPSVAPSTEPSTAPSTDPSVAPGTSQSPAPGQTTAALSLDKSKATVYTGNASNKVTVKATVTGASDTVSWKSGNTKVAKVSGDGNTATITAVGKGTATITATANGIKKTVKVTVKNPTITVKDGKKSVASKLNVSGKKTVTLTVTTNPKKAGTSLAKLSSKDKKVLTATLKNGKITIKGKKKGKVTLSVKSGKAVKKITVTVK